MKLVNAFLQKKIRKNSLNCYFFGALQFIIAALLAVAAAAPSSTYPAYPKPAITIVSQSDVRNADGSSQWRLGNFPAKLICCDHQI